MLKSTLLVLTCACIIVSCKTKPKEKPSTSGEIPGHWLVLYPDHHLKTVEEREAYKKAQDSIVGLMGLKLVHFSTNGEFMQADSSFAKPGRWMTGGDKRFLINDGGKGFGEFKGVFVNLENDTMRISQELALEKEKIEVVWHLKRIDAANAQLLFGEQPNWWRKKTTTTEDEAALKKRLKAVLDYSAAYFTLVSKESAYFIQSSAPLPFKYYQHAIGLKDFRTDSDFYQLFYDEANAVSAYNVLSKAMKELENTRFPSGKDFIIEYAGYMKQVSSAIR
jgi:hypothetical protein